MYDRFLSYSKKTGEIYENPLFSLGTSHMLKIESTEEDSLEMGKRLMIERLNVFNTRRSPSPIAQNLKVVTHLPSP